MFKKIACKFSTSYKLYWQGYNTKCWMASRVEDMTSQAIKDLSGRNLDFYGICNAFSQTLI